LAHGYTAAHLASSYSAVEAAKVVVQAAGGNPSLVSDHDVALAHLDASLGSGSEQTSARAKLDALGHKHG